VDQSPNENAVLRLARAHRLSVYDAAYLELAQRECLPLATLDADLRKAAAGEGVTIVSPSAPEVTPPDATLPES
jgi:predicted nucleic acid-binding protein